MINLLVILIIIKVHAQNNTFKEKGLRIEVARKDADPKGINAERRKRKAEWCSTLELL